MAPCQGFPCLNYREDHSSVSSPILSLRLEISFGKVSPDGIHRLVGASETLRKDHVLAQLVEELFDTVEPKSSGRHDVEIIARICSQPFHHLGIFVGGAFIQDQVQVDPGRS